MFRDLLFMERQNASTWVYIILIATGILSLAIVLPDSGGNTGAVRGMTGMSFLIVTVVILNLTTMDTRVYQEEVVVHFGRLFHYYTKRYPIESLDSAKVVEFKPIRQTGGWGIRWGKIDGEGARVFTMRGDRGVLFSAGDQRFLIGSRNPERLHAVIEEAIAGNQG